MKNYRRTEKISDTPCRETHIPAQLRRRRRRYKLIRALFPMSLTVLIIVLTGICSAFILQGTGFSPSASRKPPTSNSDSAETTSPAAPDSGDFPASKEPETSEESAVSPPVIKDTNVPASAAADNSYFDDAAFIGDSRTEGFMLYTDIKNASFYTSKGLMVNTFFTKPVIRQGDKKLTIPQALEEKSFGKVYIMLGINELGWSYSSVFKKTYGDLIDKVRELEPGAVIYIQSILPVTKEKSDSDPIYNNAKIREYNSLLAKLAEEKGVCYLNVQESVGLDGGALPKEASTDGIHLNKAYCEKWLNYLKTHTVK